MTSSSFTRPFLKRINAVREYTSSVVSVPARKKGISTAMLFHIDVTQGENQARVVTLGGALGSGGGGSHMGKVLPPPRRSPSNGEKLAAGARDPSKSRPWHIAHFT